MPLPKASSPSIPVDTRPLIKLAAMSVEGARSLPNDRIAETYRPYVGRTVSQADLAKIAGKVSDLYREAGYHLSRAIVPPQNIESGRVRLRVIEGKIAEIVLKGEGAERFGVRAILGVVTAEQPSRLETLERQLLLVNDLPGVHIVDTALEEIGEATGRFRLIVYLETWRIYAMLGLDNANLSAVGPLQANLAAAFNSYFTQGDALTVNLATVPDTPRELRFGRLAYEMPVGIDGVRFGATASSGEIWPGDERRNLNTRIQADTYALRAGIVPLQTRKFSFSLTATTVISNVSETSSLGTDYRDKVRNVGLTADARLQDEWGGVNYLTLGLRQGIDVLGASRKGDAYLSRDDASNNAGLFDFAFTRYQKLSETWSLKISAAGQLASTALLASQEFYLNWLPFGRGYHSGEFSGDNGIAGAVELRFNQQLVNDIVKGYQLYGFFGRGTVWNFRDGKDDVLSLSSAGAGVRLYFADELQASVAIAVPLPEHSLANESRQPRVFFSLLKSFNLCPERIQMRCS